MIKIHWIQIFVYFRKIDHVIYFVVDALIRAEIRDKMFKFDIVQFFYERVRRWIARIEIRDKNSNDKMIKKNIFKFLIRFCREIEKTDDFFARIINFRKHCENKLTEINRYKYWIWFQKWKIYRRKNRIERRWFCVWKC